MNPRSGGGNVTKFRLKEKAKALGAEVVMLDDPEIIAALARKAAAEGCGLLEIPGVTDPGTGGGDRGGARSAAPADSRRYPTTSRWI
jgi:hypothetical protein